ncbi:hypothetical protein AS189_06690 [Arthrobacter alpinus]|uniref:THIF-type NAD/FAD binding fold domain-containing protein n=1 Tax=Arthrobacter alpinus TaxID=656366 RepID=A0A0S2LXT7_9MICC|nr:hypothetical protein AS189_06690 [Arthrobacter alpinus]
MGPGGLILEGLEGPDLAFIMALRRGIADALVLDHAVELGVPAPRAQEICAMLATVLCQDAELSTHGYREERLRPDRIALLGLYRKSAKKLLAQRKKNVVQVVGLGRTGAALAGVLANAGVGTLLLEDDSPVTAADVSPSSFLVADIGIPRSLALRRHLTALDPGTQIHMVHDGGAGGPSLRNLDLAVVVGQDVAPAAITARFMSTELPHLVVLHREQDGTVGPLVMPGETACADCVEWHRNTGDSHWLEICGELAAGEVAAGEVAAGGGSPGKPPGSPPSGRGGNRGAQPASSVTGLESTALSLALAGTAATQALLFLDGVNQPGAWSAVMMFRPDTGCWTEQVFSAHPECGCQWQNQPAATISRTASP